MNDLNRPGAAPQPHLDLSMVRALAALVTERSVSRAAETLGQSQPQMSTTLRRLRTLIGDPILVRGARGMVPTEHAMQLLEPARRVLADVQLLLTPPATQDSLRRARPIQIAAPDYLGAHLLAAIMQAVRREAPEATVVIRSVRGDAEGAELLESGQADLLIESSIVAAATVRYALLFQDEVLSVAARGHPLVVPDLSVQGYLGLPHVAAAPASGLSPGIIDRMLAEQGMTRRVVARVPYLNALPPILARTDLVFTTAANLARFFGSLPGLQTFSPPIAFAPVRYFLMWHERVHRSAEHRWMRRLLHSVVEAELGLPATARGMPDNPAP